MVKKISLLPILLSGLFVAAIAAYASDSFTVNYAATQQITGPDSVCKKVTNYSPTGASEYIPTTSAAEWQSFVASPPAGVTLASCSTPGSQTYSISGTYTFTVPAYNALTVQVWGGGGSGEGGTRAGAAAGGQSSWNGAVVADGGGAGSWFEPGAGGSAWGGTTNITGSAGSSWNGGDSPYGGAGGVVGSAGAAPGGGGGGEYSDASFGGGGGGYSSRTYSTGQLTVGASIPVVVGAGGNNAYIAGDGAVGRVYITWN